MGNAVLENCGRTEHRNLIYSGQGRPVHVWEAGWLEQGIVVERGLGRSVLDMCEGACKVIHGLQR